MSYVFFLSFVAKGPGFIGLSWFLILFSKDVSSDVLAGGHMVVIA